MGLVIEYSDGQTPLDEDEREYLLIKSIITRDELHEFEQQNIEKAVEWSMSKQFNSETILSESFIKKLHHLMFKDVWKWAGEFRRTDKNIGVDKNNIGTALKQLIDDCKFWIANKIYSDEEIAIRFKHNLVSIHCFSNGNGRHSRLMADIIIHQVFGKPFFIWGRSELINKVDLRKEYLKALRHGDKGDMQPLILFACKTKHKQTVKGD